MAVCHDIRMSIQCHCTLRKPEWESGGYSPSLARPAIMGGEQHQAAHISLVTRMCTRCMSSLRLNNMLTPATPSIILRFPKISILGSATQLRMPALIVPSTRSGLQIQTCEREKQMESASFILHRCRASLAASLKIM